MILLDLTLSFDQDIVHHDGFTVSLWFFLLKLDWNTLDTLWYNVVASTKLGIPNGIEFEALPKWFKSLDNDRYDWRTRMIICGYYRSLNSNNTRYDIPWIILKLSVEYFYFNIYDLGITNTNASHIWLAIYSGNNTSKALKSYVYLYLKPLFDKIENKSKYDPQTMIENVMNRNYINNNNDFIEAEEFDKFYKWFLGICNIIPDLFPYFTLKRRQVSLSNYATNFAIDFDAENINLVQLLSSMDDDDDKSGSEYPSTDLLDVVFDAHIKTYNLLKWRQFTVTLSSIPNCIEIAVKWKKHGSSLRFYCLKRLKDGSYLGYDGTKDRANCDLTVYHNRHWQDERWFPNFAAIMDTLSDEGITFHGSYKKSKPLTQSKSIQTSIMQPGYHPLVLRHDYEYNDRFGSVMTADILVSTYERTTALEDWLEEMSDYDRNTKMIISGYLRIYFQRFWSDYTVIVPQIITYLCILYFDFDIYQHTKIRHRYAARIWLEIYQDRNNLKFARMDDLYEPLMREFVYISHCDARQPTRKQLSSFLLPFEYHLKWNLIEDSKFEAFHAWFLGICFIMKDLRYVYEKEEDPLSCLFLSRDDAEDILEDAQAGTFLLRLSGGNRNGLAIAYKTAWGKVSHVLLVLMNEGVYTVGSSGRNTRLSPFIQSWKQLKWFYTEKRLIDKREFFV